MKYTGAANEDITAAEEATCPWPEEFRELYRCVAGADDRRGMFVDTGHGPPYGSINLWPDQDWVPPTTPVAIAQCDA
ncbi:SMI1/KNR4 family protein [Prescottella equi]|uniref:SMI1/KNR4 family protein n=1 Tax=Rhodococcus hoagii TaxID=43767 RepID=UPI0007CD44AE|nr:SMI1/KNR4 family protein [Prescottella equi]